MTLAERIKQAFESKGITAYKAEKDISISRSLLGKYMSGESEPSVSNIERIADYLEIDINWLISGQGDMNKKNSAKNDTNGELIQLSEEEAPYGVNERSLKFRPHIESATGSCGAPNGFNQAIMEHECESISLPFMVNYDFSIRAAGDSMINRENPKRSIRNKDVIACKYWTSRSHIRWGEVYALATRDGIVIKKIMPSEKEGCIKCVSFNESDGFIPYDLDLEEVTDWAIVVGVVSIEAW